MSHASRLLLCIGLCLCAALGAVGQDKVELRLKLKQGDAYPLRTTTKQDITQTAMGQTQQVGNELTFDYTIRAIEVGADGVASVSFVYDRIRNRQSGAAGNLSYDSAAKDQTGNPLAATFGALVGHELRMKLAPDGTVSEVSGTEELAARMADAMKPADDEERKVLQENAKKQWGPDAIREMLGQNMSIYPEKPVAVGDSWQKEYALTQGFPVSVKTTYTLKAVENGVATVDARSVISSSATASEAQGMPVPITYVLNGAQSGTLHLDVATGWYRDGHMAQEFSGDVKLQAGGDAGSMSVPMAVKSDIAIEVPKDGAAAPTP